MSGLCSAHQDHKKGCPQCEALPEAEDIDEIETNNWYIIELSILKNHKSSPPFRLGCGYYLESIKDVVKENSYMMSWYNENQFKISCDDYSLMFKKIIN